MKQIMIGGWLLVALLLALSSLYGCTRIVTYLEPKTGIERGYCSSSSAGQNMAYPFRCWAAEGQVFTITQRDGKEYTIRPEDGVMIFDNKISPPRKAQ